MFVTAAVFHREISPLNEDAPKKMFLGVGRQGWAWDCRDATLPRAARRDSAKQVKSNMGEKKRRMQR